MLKLLVLPVTVYVMVDPNKLTNTTTKMPRADPCADPLKIGEPLDELNSTIKVGLSSGRLFPFSVLFRQPTVLVFSLWEQRRLRWSELLRNGEDLP